LHYNHIGNTQYLTLDKNPGIYAVSARDNRQSITLDKIPENEVQYQADSLPSTTLSTLYLFDLFTEIAIAEVANQSHIKRHISYCVTANSHIVHMGTHSAGFRGGPRAPHHFHVFSHMYDMCMPRSHFY